MSVGDHGNILSNEERHCIIAFEINLFFKALLEFEKGFVLLLFLPLVFWHHILSLGKKVTHNLMT